MPNLTQMIVQWNRLKEIEKNLNDEIAVHSYEVFSAKSELKVVEGRIKDQEARIAMLYQSEIGNG